MGSPGDACDGVSGKPAAEARKQALLRDCWLISAGMPRQSCFIHVPMHFADGLCRDTSAKYADA